MTDTNPCSSRRRLDPRKRVNYTMGLVLGEDEFVQEQTHLRERDDLAVRALHGYGTVSGLSVRWDADDGQVRVAPGLAVDPAGRLVCVPSEQCADLAGWLTEHRDMVAEAAGLDEGELPDELSLYVAVCYRECETDTVPVPSETCRTGDESMAASRIMESFELRLLLAPPGPAGELADGALNEAIGRLLELADDLGDDDEVDADALRRELVDWATLQRPELDERPCLGPPEDDCGERTDEPSTAVLLARLDLGLDDAGDGRVLPVGPEVDDDERPVLLSSRYLQEWLTGLVAHPELFAPGDHSELENLDADDHPQYLLADGSRALTGTLNAGHNHVLNLRPSRGPTHAMRRDEIEGHDLTRTGDGLEITALQGEPVQASGDDAPTAGDVLRYDGSRWVPAAVGDGDGAPDPLPPTPIGTVLPFVTIELIGRHEVGASFLLWFHLEAPDASVVLAPGELEEPLVYGENVEVLTEACEDAALTLRRVGTNRAEVRQVACNVFRVDVNRQEAEFLRFVFHLERIFLDTGDSVAAFAEERAITWVGQADERTVTSFVINPSAGRPLGGFENIDHVVAPSGGGRITVDRR